MYWERNAGVAISFTLGGMVASHGYERLFLIDAATTMLFAVVVLWKVPETRPPGVPAVQPEVATAPTRGFAAVLGDVHFRRLLILNVAFLVGLFQFMVALPLHMTSLGLTPSDYGRTMAVNGVLIVLLSPWVARLTKSFDAGRTLAAGALLAGLGYGAYGLATTRLGFAAATVIWSLGEIVTVPVISALVARLSPGDLRGRYQGIFGTSFGAALALAPWTGGVVVGRLGAAVLWNGVMVLCGLVAVAHLAAGRARVMVGFRGPEVPDGGGGWR